MEGFYLCLTLFGPTDLVGPGPFPLQSDIFRARMVNRLRAGIVVTTQEERSSPPLFPVQTGRDLAARPDTAGHRAPIAMSTHSYGNINRSPRGDLKTQEERSSPAVFGSNRFRFKPVWFKPDGTLHRRDRPIPMVK